MKLSKPAISLAFASLAVSVSVVDAGHKSKSKKGTGGSNKPESDDAGNAEKTFEGVVLFESYERAEVDAWFERITLEETETTSFVELRGFAKSTDLLNLETDDAMYNLNARPTADFVYIRPFLGGREYDGSWPRITSSGELI